MKLQKFNFANFKFRKNLEVSSDIKIFGWWDHDLDKTITESLKNNKI